MLLQLKYRFRIKKQQSLEKRNKARQGDVESPSRDGKSRYCRFSHFHILNFSSILRLFEIPILSKINHERGVCESVMVYASLSIRFLQSTRFLQQDSCNTRVSR